MANIYSLKSGLASDLTVWSGGVVPTAGDRVLVKAGHTVEVNAAHEWGDDLTTTIVIDGYSTTASITIAGTLKHSRTVSSSLLCRGQFHVRDGGKHDIGTELDPILLPVTATILLNHSLSMANNKYGYLGDSLHVFSAYGSPRVRVAKLTEATLVGASSIKVSQAVGWQPGDTIVLSQTDLSASRRQDLAVIHASYVAGDLVVPLAGTLSFTHSLTCVVGNMSSNVTVKSSNPAFDSGAFHLFSNNLSAVNSRAMRYVSFENIGATGAAAGIALRFPSNTSAINWVQPFGDLRDLSHLRRLATGVMVVTTNCSSATPMHFQDCVFAQTFANDSPSFMVVTQHTWFGRCCFFGTTISFGGATNVIYKDCHVLGRGRDGIATNQGVSPLVTGLKLGGFTQNGGLIAHHTAQAYCSELNIIDCEFGVTYPLSTNAPLFFLSALDAQQTVTAKDCVFGANVIEPTVNSMNCLTSESWIRVVNRNKDVTNQQEYRREGVYRRDNTERFRGTSSLSMRPNAVGRLCKRSRLVPCVNGSTVRLLGYVKMDAAYLNGSNCTPPTVTLSGLGVTPQVFTMALNTDWQQFDLSATNVSGLDGELSLVLEATPLSVATGTVYIDGIPDAPFVTKVRHYGFMFDEGLPIRTVNPVVQAAEAIADAYTGVTINPVTPKITVGAGTANTWRKLYDHYQSWACNNIASDVLLTSVDGVNFTLPLTCKLEWLGMPADGTLSGGWLQLAVPGVHSYSLSGSKIDFMAAGTYNMSGTQFSGTVELVNSSGGAVVVQAPVGVSYTNTGPNITVELPSLDVVVSAPALISGTRVQLYNLTDDVEVLNAELVSAGMTYTTPFSSNKIMRLRADHASKLPLETVGVLTASGLTFLDVQAEDDVYLANSVDGSTVTEFAPDGPNLQVDINDPDGTTKVQRLYAWMQWYMTTEEGIASPFFGSIYAVDEFNYIVDQSKVNLKLDNISPIPLLLIGARIARKDGSALIAASSGSIQIEPGFSYSNETGVSGLTADESSKLNQVSLLALETTAQSAATAAAAAAVQATEAADNTATLLGQPAPTAADVAAAVWSDAKASTLALEATAQATLAASEAAPTAVQTASAVWSHTQ